MAADVGGLVADIGLNVAGLREDIKRSNRELQRGTNRMNRHLGGLRRQVNTVSRSFKGLAAAVSVGFLARQMKQTIDSADEMLKLTQRIGGTTEAFSELEFVADRSGVAFNTLTMGLQRMTRRIGEAADGSGEAQNALKTLGLDARALSQIPIDQQLERIADELSKVENESRRAALATKIFDSEGLQLVQMMTKGADGIRELRAEARKLGVTLTRDHAEAAAQANDALTNLDAQVSSLSRNLTLNLVPALAKSIEGWNLFLFPDEATQLRTRLAEIRQEIDQINSGLGTGLGGPLGLGENSIGDQTERLRELREEMFEVLKAMSDLRNAPVVDSAGDAGSAAGRSFVEGFQAELGLGEKLSADSLIPELSADQVFPLRDIVGSAFEDLDGIAADTDMQLTKPMKDEFDEIQAAADQAARNIQDGFADFLFDPFAEGLDGMVEGFFTAIRRMLANQAASQLFGWLSSAIGGGGNPSDPGGHIGAGLNAQFAGAFADGGSFKVGGSGGTDSQLVMFQGTPGEPVAVGERFVGQGGGDLVFNNVNNISADGFTQAQLAVALDRNTQRTIGELQRMRDKGRF